jgi:cytochrome c556
MRRYRAIAAALAFAAFGAGTAVPARGESPPVPFQAQVDMKTFMEHVLTPAATVIWRVNGSVIDAAGEHDLSPRTDGDWERIVSGAATLAEATNALMIPERVRDRQWIAYVQRLAAAAATAYRAAENHDLKTVSEVSDRLDGICAACHRHYGLE